MAWPWVAAQLSGMVAGEFKKISTNTLPDVSLARTRANFDAGSKFANDAAVASALPNTVASYAAFSGHAINGDTGTIIARGGGHTDGGDGTIFKFNTSTLAWEILAKGPRYESTAPTVSCNISAIASGTPPRLTVDADIAISGDQGVITGTTDADGTYQLVRVDSTHVDLYNIDGSASAQFTAFSGGSLTDSTGTLTITWNPQNVSADTYYAQTNADGDQMPPCVHTYHHDRWIGGNKYVLGGTSVFDGNGGVTPNRLWMLDEDATPKVTRGYHDTRTGNGLYLTNEAHAGRGTGAIAYNSWDGQLYASDATASIFDYRTYRWSTDYLTKLGIELDGSAAYPGFSEGLVLPVPGASTQRMLFGITSTSAWTECSDIESGGSPLQASHSFASTLFTTGITVGIHNMGRCWDSLNETIVYWGGGSAIGEILPDSDFTAWDSQEVTPGTPTGDLPTSTGSTHMCNIAKVPDHDAYLLVQAGDVYLYYRSTATARLTDFTLDADGTIGSVIRHDAGTGTPFYTHANDAPDGNSSDYVENDTSETSGEAWFSLADIDADVDSISTLAITVDVLASGFGGDTCTLTARVFDADNDTTTPLTDESGNLATEADTTRTQRTVSFTGVTGSKTAWDGAYIRFTWTYSQNAGPDNATLRLYGCELGGTYIAAASPASIIHNPARHFQHMMVR